MMFPCHQNEWISGKNAMVNHGDFLLKFNNTSAIDKI